MPLSPTLHGSGFSGIKNARKIAAGNSRSRALGLTPGCHPPPHANSVIRASAGKSEGTTSSGVLSEDQPAQVPPNSELVGAH
jgi:hypothetical protein